VKPENDTGVANSVRFRRSGTAHGGYGSSLLLLSVPRSISSIAAMPQMGSFAFSNPSATPRSFSVDVTGEAAHPLLTCGLRPGSRQKSRK